MLFVRILHVAAIFAAATALTRDSINELEEVLSELIALRESLSPVVHYLDQDGSWSYDNEWVVRVPGGESDAMLVANHTGTKYVGRVRGFPDLFLLRGTFAANSMRRRKREADALSERIKRDNNVLWSEQQKIRQRTKRSMLPRKPVTTFNDPLWSQQWQLHSTSNRSRLSHQIEDAWNLGYTGQGVVVSVLDDGIDYKHEDLAKNYDPSISWDLNDEDDDPFPTLDEFNKHGTRCAGEIVMAANNSKCGVGVAFNAKIGGIRLLDGKVTDRIEAEALNFALDRVDIMSASWGPNDDGKTVEGPGTLTQLAILKGIREGRNGRGTIYVWASGNGGANADDCNCDGYADSVYTLAVASADPEGKFPWYGERCASTLTTTYSSGASKELMIVTTDPGNKCTTDHTGTSASAPIAVGIIALGLEANPKLTWRDVQHIAVWTSQPEPLLDNDGWQLNAAGLLFNSKFGFGLMNAYEFVKAAVTWKTVPELKICTTHFPGFRKRSISSNDGYVIEIESDACRGSGTEIRHIEHVQLVADIDSSARGRVSIVLESPQGTQSQLLAPRNGDISTAGFRQWPFTTVHFWGEAPRGIWRLHISDFDEHVGGNPTSSFINNITLVMYGTHEEPAHYQKSRSYDGIDMKAYKDRAGSTPHRTAGANTTAAKVFEHNTELAEALKSLAVGNREKDSDAELERVLRHPIDYRRMWRD